jgi:hypothetical protein
MLMLLSEKLSYFKRGRCWASIVERKGRDGIGEKKGLTHGEPPIELGFGKKKRRR